MTLEMTTDLLTSMLTIAGKGAPIQRVSDVHVRYWLCEHTTHAVLSLLEAVPSASSVVVANLQSQNAQQGLHPGVELSVCSAIQEYLLENLTNVTSMGQAQLFSDNVRAVRLGFVEVINRVDSSLLTAGLSPDKTLQLRKTVLRQLASLDELVCLCSSTSVYMF